MYVSPPEAARGKFWLFAPFWGEFGPFLTFNNVNNSKHWPTLNNVKEFCQCYANIKTQTQRLVTLRDGRWAGESGLLRPEAPKQLHVRVCTRAAMCAEGAGIDGTDGM